MFRNAAIRSSRSRCHFRTSHAFSAHDARQILVRKLRNKFLHRDFSICHIFQHIPVVSRICDLFRQIFLAFFRFLFFACRNRFTCQFKFAISIFTHFETIECFYRRKCLFQFFDHFLLNNLKIRAFFRITNIGTHINPVCSRFKHHTIRRTGNSGIVIRCKDRKRNGYFYHFFFTRFDHTRFCKSAKTAGGLTEFSLRCFHVCLNHVFSRCFSGIFHLHLNLASEILTNGKIDARIAECRIREPITKRIQHFLFCHRFKIPVSDINVFHIKVFVFAAKIGRRWVIFYFFCNRIGQMPTRGHSSGQHIGDTITTDHASLPHDHLRLAGLQTRMR